MEKIQRVFTHSGVFHGDDCFAVAMCQILSPSAKVFRVMELPEDFSAEDVAVDVGGKFSPTEMVFDHHFKDGSKDGLAAAGKFWSVYGPEICQIVGCPSEINGRVTDRVYLTLLGSIDRADIAISDWSPINEEWRHVSASAFISTLNAPFGSDPKVGRERFDIAVEASKASLLGTIEQSVSWIEMFDIVKNGHKIDGKILWIAKGGPWQEHVFGSEKLDNILYVIYPSDRGGYLVQCVPDKLGSFGARKFLPESWKGLRGQELVDLLGSFYEPTQALFCHPGRFIAGAETQPQAVGLAREACLALA